MNSKIEAEANLAKKKTAKGKKKNNKTSTSTKKQPQRKKIQWVDQQTRGRQYLETSQIPGDGLQQLHYNPNKRHHLKTILKVFCLNLT